MNIAVMLIEKYGANPTAVNMVRVRSDDRSMTTQLLSSYYSINMSVQVFCCIDIIIECMFVHKVR